jgi:hypothetical protein
LEVSDLDDLKVMKVLQWMKISLEAIDSNPSPQNINSFISQIISNKEVVRDALIYALRPEFRELGYTISELLGAGVPTEEKDMAGKDDSRAESPIHNERVPEASGDSETEQADGGS